MLTVLSSEKEDCEDALALFDFNPEHAAALLFSGSVEPASDSDGTGDDIRGIDLLRDSDHGILEGKDEDGEGDFTESTFTADEKAQITRLQELGFDRDLVIRVFVMCDKDENLAANCLLAMAHDS
jgi:hypothetical protein